MERRKLGKQLQLQKQRLQEQEVKQIADEIAREKAEEKAARERIREQIAQDRYLLPSCVNGLKTLAEFYFCYSEQKGRPDIMPRRLKRKNVIKKFSERN